MGSLPPEIIQGGMGIGVSSWKLAGAVARAGAMGVVSGTALETVYARRLQLGDLDGSVRRALAHFPVPEVARQVVERYFVEGGKAADEPFRGVSMYTLRPSPELQLLSVVSNFAEVWLAKEAGGGGPIGINYLYKIQMPLPACLYGAMLAGVDYVIVGAGSPEAVPELLRAYSAGVPGTMPIKVQYAAPTDVYAQSFDPRVLFADRSPPELAKPRFLAIVASVDLARRLRLDEACCPDGFVIEGYTAGGHNAPPRGPLKLDPRGQPVYGMLDEVDLGAIASLGLPFWLAGTYGRPSALRDAQVQGAAGIQVGTAFAFCEESGLTSELRERVLASVVEGSLSVRTDSIASPTGFPFKIVELAGTVSDDVVYEERRRVCDAGFLRMPYKTPSGEVGYRCPAEPATVYERKSGRAQQTEGRLCLCNGLLANIGLGQRRSDGRSEPALLTAGDDVLSIRRYLGAGASSYSATEVVAALRRGA
ncbi:MAG: nitronate monooxygenase [Deltaproteobacteria bacterium]|nr:nitronate monooxygenase [Deltaproteobacteria bacterium]